MLLDLKKIKNGEHLKTNICIIGGGAAGICIALELKKKKKDVILIESGGWNFDSETQKLYDGENKGGLLNPYSRYLYSSRLRYFGGSTNHWAGYCRPLDPIDFEKRSWVPESGWPFTFLELKSYYKRACQYLRINDFKIYDRNKKKPGFDLMRDSSLVVTKIFHIAKNLRFSKVYRKRLAKSHRTKILLHANVTHIQSSENGRNIQYVEVQSLLKNKVKIQADKYVLAVGGIENARLLLLSRDVHKKGIGNENGLIGRYFMEHPHVPSGGVYFFKRSDNLKYYSRHYNRYLGHYISGTLCLSESALRKNKLLNMNIQLLNRFKRLKDGKIIDHSRKIAGKNYLGFPLLQKNIQKGKYVFLKTRSEQIPNWNSYVTLSARKDRFGLNRASLHWDLTRQDKESVIKSLLLFGKELGYHDLGRLNCHIEEEGEWPDLSYGGSHHIGTTRMNNDPRKGVVNSNGKVHGISNLFIAGSSVFPTGGGVNPTLTIMALAIRLSDHLNS